MFIFTGQVVHAKMSFWQVVHQKMSFWHISLLSTLEKRYYPFILFLIQICFVASFTSGFKEGVKNVHKKLTSTETLDMYLHHSSYTTFQRPGTTCLSLGCSTLQNSSTVWTLHHTPLQQTAYLEGERGINLLARQNICVVIL